MTKFVLKRLLINAFKQGQMHNVNASEDVAEMEANRILKYCTDVDNANTLCEECLRPFSEEIHYCKHCRKVMCSRCCCSNCSYEIWQRPDCVLNEEDFLEITKKNPEVDSVSAKGVPKDFEYIKENSIKKNSSYYGRFTYKINNVIFGWCSTRYKEGDIYIRMSIFRIRGT